MKKFRYIATIVALLLFALPIEAENSKALYVHRNDGDFNAFFFSEIDSIVYSMIDVDSVLCEDYVTQEIWTPDTVVRIPLSVIEDVSLETPSTIYKEGVIILDKEKQNWISKCDSLTLYYPVSIPKAHIPQVGDKLVTTDMNELFPIGFLGKVKSIISEGNYIKVECDQINISDAFDRYYCVVEGESEPSSSDAARASIDSQWITVPLLSRKFEFPLDFSLDCKPNEYCALGFGMSSEASIEWVPKLRYIYVNDYDYKYVSISLDNFFICSTKTSMFGHFTVDKEFSKSIDVIVKEIPFTKFYMKYGPRIEFSGGIAMDYEQRETYVFPYRYTRSTSPNVKKQNGFKKPIHKESSWVPDMLAGNVTLYGGWFLELGYGLLIEDWGKVYVRGDAGMEFKINADLGKIDDAPYSTKLYDTAHEDDLFSISRSIAFGGTAGISAELGPLHAGVKLGDMIRIPLDKWSLFPNFSDIKYLENNGGHSSLSCNIGHENNLLLPVPVGFKVLDEKREEVFCEYNKNIYLGFNFNKYEIPYKYNKVNAKYTAYPVFKLLGKYEILASPSIELNKEIKPITNGANVTQNNATISGSIEGNVNSVGEYEVGFYYGTQRNPQTTGKRIVSTLSQNGSFTSTLSNLNNGTVYYYCAYLLIDGEYFYGETKQFETSKAPVFEVRTGKPITIEKKLAIVSGYAMADDITDCKYGILFSFSPNSDVWYIAEGEKWQDGNYIATVYFLEGKGDVIYYKAYLRNANDYLEGELLKVEKEKPGLLSCPDDHHPHMIDLDLPSGTKWACCNVGASWPGGYGGYYAWGETQEKEKYTLYESHNTDFDIAGTDYDAAHVHWGNGWRTPTPEQCDELLTYSTRVWTKRDGVNGCEFTGFNGGTIFLPAAGYREEEYTCQKDHKGAYLLSQYVEFDKNVGEHWGFELYGGDLVVYTVETFINYTTHNKGHGFTVRPVRKN